MFLVWLKACYIVLCNRSRPYNKKHDISQVTCKFLTWQESHPRRNSCFRPAFWSGESSLYLCTHSHWLKNISPPISKPEGEGFVKIKYLYKFCLHWRFLKYIFMQDAKHTRPGGYFKVWATNNYLSRGHFLAHSGCVRLASLGRPWSAPVHVCSYSFDRAQLGQPRVPFLWSGSLGGDLRCMSSPREGECDR